MNLVSKDVHYAHCVCVWVTMSVCQSFMQTPSRFIHIDA